jgi:cell division protein FtsI/penicillin-binding protein 2
MTTPINSGNATPQQRTRALRGPRQPFEGTGSRIDSAHDTSQSPSGELTGWTIRERIVLALLSLCWVAIALRLLQIQVWQQPHFTQQALRQQTTEEIVPARPGDIFDRHGRLLATTIKRHSLYLNPATVDDIPLVAMQLAGALQLDADELERRLEQSGASRFLWVKRRLTEEEAAAVRELDLDGVDWGFQPEFQRLYPQGRLAAHVIGLRDIDGKGQGGIEEWFDSTLRGADGRRTLVRDAHGYVIEVQRESVVPQMGESIALTIDSAIQLYVEQALDGLVEEFHPTHACAIVLDPHSGDVLAMSSRPTFDPNNLTDVPEGGWTNSAVTAAFEPGSTLKPFIVAWALDQDVLEREQVIDCEWGAYRMGRRVLHDHHSYGELSVEDILVKSSNIGMAKIGELLGNENLHAAATAFGFGRRTGIEIPGELPGVLRPLDDWTSYSTGSIPMGQELTATPLQIITAHAALANGGEFITPHLLLTAESRDSRARQVVTYPLVEDETAQWLVEGPMTAVVDRGTGRLAQIEGYDVFGKTGTAQKADPENGGYSHSLHVSSFLCGAPSEDPEVLVLVTVDEPEGSQYGGTVAAPTAAKILEQTLEYLGVPRAE